MMLVSISTKTKDSLQHELVADSYSSDMITPIGIERLSYDVPLSPVCCVVVVWNGVVSEVDFHVHLGASDSFQLVEL